MLEIIHEPAYNVECWCGFKRISLRMWGQAIEIGEHHIRTAHPQEPSDGGNGGEVQISKATSMRWENR